MQQYPSEHSSEHPLPSPEHLDGHAWSHPDPALLEGLLRGELSAAECRTVVRHLLTGCPRCARITSECWSLGNRRRRGSR